MISDSVNIVRKSFRGNPYESLQGRHAVELAAFDARQDLKPPEKREKRERLRKLMLENHSKILAEIQHEGLGWEGDYREGEYNVGDEWIGSGRNGGDIISGAGSDLQSQTESQKIEKPQCQRGSQTGSQTHSQSQSQNISNQAAQIDGVQERQQTPTKEQLIESSKDMLLHDLMTVTASPEFTAAAIRAASFLNGQPRSVSLTHTNMGPKKAKPIADAIAGNSSLLALYNNTKT
jgi:hypothetical protein